MAGRKSSKQQRLAELPDRISLADAKKLHLLSGGRINKYNNETAVVQGKGFDSKHEGRRYGELLLLQSAGQIKDLQTQVRFVLFPKSAHGPEIVYIADFVYYDTALQREVVEDAKGVRTKEYRLKKRMMAELLGITIQEV